MLCKGCEAISFAFYPTVKSSFLPYFLPFVYLPNLNFQNVLLLFKKIDEQLRLRLKKKYIIWSVINWHELRC